MNKFFKQGFNFYGFNAVVESNDKRLVRNIERDFAFFKSNNRNDKPFLHVRALNKKPNFALIPKNKKKSMIKDTCYCIDYNGERFVNYSDRALSIIDFANKNAKIESNDKHLLHEIAYIIVLSIIGEQLDKKGLHRVHALGFSYKNKNALVLLPLAGGKTTLALDLLKNRRVKLVSEDTPLLNGNNEVLPFPIRFGVNAEDKIDFVPSRFKRFFTRMKYGNKVLIDIGYVRKQIANIGKIDFVFVGKRVSTKECRIEKMNKLRALPSLIEGLIIGYGIAQPKEYFFQKKALDWLNKASIGFSRSKSALKLLLKNKFFCFTIGVEKEKNAQALLRFLEKN